MKKSGRTPSLDISAMIISIDEALLMQYSFAPFMKTMTSLVLNEPLPFFEIVISVAPSACLIERATMDA